MHIAYRARQDGIRRVNADIGSGVAENHLMDDIILPKFRSAVAESFVQTDLGYGDGIASRRLKDALGRYFAEYVYPRVNPPRTWVGDGRRSYRKEVASGLGTLKVLASVHGEAASAWEELVGLVGLVLLWRSGR